MMRHIWWRVLFAYALGFVVLFAIWSAIEHSAQQQYAALVTRGVSVTGVVTSYTPSNHDDLEYAFMVQGKRFSGGGPFHIQGNFKVGQQVAVVYQRDSPTNSCACDPQAELSNANNGPIVGGLWLGLAFPVWYLIMRKRWRPGR